MTRRIPASYASIYTEADIAESVADLAIILQQAEEETDPNWREALMAMARDDAAWLAELIELVRGPALPLRLPIGLPAPGPWVEMAAK